MRDPGRDGQGGIVNETMKLVCRPPYDADRLPHRDFVPHVTRNGLAFVRVDAQSPHVTQGLVQLFGTRSGQKYPSTSSGETDSQALSKAGPGTRDPKGFAGECGPAV